MLPGGEPAYDQPACENRARHGPACDERGCGGRARHGPAPGPAPGISQAWLREVIIRHAVGLLSGPAGLAAWLRTGLLDGPAATISLPLDTGKPTETIPPHLRRAVIRRDRHCAFPGCQQPPPACQVHHIIPRSRGGLTALGNLLLLCPFHHLTVIHRWGWAIALHPDGTTTATSPEHTKILHSHAAP